MYNMRMLWLIFYVWPGDSIRRWLGITVEQDGSLVRFEFVRPECSGARWRSSLRIDILCREQKDDLTLSCLRRVAF